MMADDAARILEGGAGLLIHVYIFKEEYRVLSGGPIAEDLLRYVQQLSGFSSNGRRLLEQHAGKLTQDETARLKLLLHTVDGDLKTSAALLQKAKVTPQDVKDNGRLPKYRTLKDHPMVRSTKSRLESTVEHIDSLLADLQGKRRQPQPQPQIQKANTTEIRRAHPQNRGEDQHLKPTSVDRYVANSRQGRTRDRGSASIASSVSSLTFHEQESKQDQKPASLADSSPDTSRRPSLNHEQEIDMRSNSQNVTMAYSHISPHMLPLRTINELEGDTPHWRQHIQCVSVEDQKHADVHVVSSASVTRQRSVSHIEESRSPSSASGVARPQPASSVSSPTSVKAPVLPSLDTELRSPADSFAEHRQARKIARRKGTSEWVSHDYPTTTLRDGTSIHDATTSGSQSGILSTLR